MQKGFEKKGLNPQEEGIKEGILTNEVTVFSFPNAEEALSQGFDFQEAFNQDIKDIKKKLDVIKKTIDLEDKNKFKGIIDENILKYIKSDKLTDKRMSEIIFSLIQKEIGSKYDLAEIMKEVSKPIRGKELFTQHFEKIVKTQKGEILKEELKKFFNSKVYLKINQTKKQKQKQNIGSSATAFESAKGTLKFPLTEEEVKKIKKNPYKDTILKINDLISNEESNKYIKMLEYDFTSTGFSIDEKTGEKVDNKQLALKELLSTLEEINNNEMPFSRDKVIFRIRQLGKHDGKTYQVNGLYRRGREVKDKQESDYDLIVLRTDKGGQNATVHEWAHLNDIKVFKEAGPKAETLRNNIVQYFRNKLSPMMMIDPYIGNDKEIIARVTEIGFLLDLESKGKTSNLVKDRTNYEDSNVYFDFKNFSEKDKKMAVILKKVLFENDLKLLHEVSEDIQRVNKEKRISTSQWTNAQKEEKLLKDTLTQFDDETIKYVFDYLEEEKNNGSFQVFDKGYYINFLLTELSYNQLTKLKQSELKGGETVEGVITRVEENKGKLIELLNIFENMKIKEKVSTLKNNTEITNSIERLMSPNKIYFKNIKGEVKYFGTYRKGKLYEKLNDTMRDMEYSNLDTGYGFINLLKEEEKKYISENASNVFSNELKNTKNNYGLAQLIDFLEKTNTGLDFDLDNYIKKEIEEGEKSIQVDKNNTSTFAGRISYLVGRLNKFDTYEKRFEQDSYYEKEKKVLNEELQGHLNKISKKEKDNTISGVSFLKETNLDLSDILSNENIELLVQSSSQEDRSLFLANISPEIGLNFKKGILTNEEKKELKLKLEYKLKIQIPNVTLELEKLESENNLEIISYLKTRYNITDNSIKNLPKLKLILEFVANVVSIEQKEEEYDIYEEIEDTSEVFWFTEEGIETPIYIGDLDKREDKIKKIKEIMKVKEEEIEENEKRTIEELVDRIILDSEEILSEEQIVELKKDLKSIQNTPVNKKNLKSFIQNIIQNVDFVWKSSINDRKTDVNQVNNYENDKKCIQCNLF